MNLSIGSRCCLPASDEVSSISGSDSSSSSDCRDVDTDDLSSHLSRLRSRRQLMLRNSAGQLLTVHQCLLNMFEVCPRCTT